MHFIFFIDCYAIDYKNNEEQKKQEENTLDLVPINNEQFIQTSLDTKVLDIHNPLNDKIYKSLDNLLETDGFDLMNSNNLPLKILLSMWAPFFFGIARYNSLDIKTILASQFMIPKIINNIFSLIDKSSVIYSDTQHPIITKRKESQRLLSYNSLKIFFVMMLSAITTCEYGISGGLKCEAFIGRYTNDKNILDTAYQAGIGFTSFYTFLLIAPLLYQLLNKIMEVCNANVDLKYKENMTIINDLYTECEDKTTDKDNLEPTIQQYLSDRNLNSIHKVASLQECLSNKKQPRVSNDLLPFKISYILLISAIGGMSLMYISRSFRVLVNNISRFSEKQADGSYLFKLKDGNNTLSCDSILNCMNEIDLNAVVINKNTNSPIYDLYPNILDISNNIFGIAIASSAAIILLNAIKISSDILTSKIHTHAFKKGMFKKSKILQLCGAAFFVPALIYHMEDLIFCSNKIEKNEDFLKNTGEPTAQNFPISTKFAICVVISMLGITFSSGTNLLSNIPNAIISSFKRISDIIPKCIHKK